VAVRQRVQTLAQSLAERAHSKDALYQTIGIKLVEPPFDINTRARSLPGPVADADLVESVAMELLAEFGETDVRKVGVRVSNLSFGDEEQADLGSWEHEAGTAEATRDSDPAASGASEASDSAETQRGGETTFVGQTKLSDF
jgi:DNA polymerase IV (DinB-like DNA polymerase)